MDRGRSSTGQRPDDESGVAASGAVAQKKTLIATEQDPVARAAWREAIAGTDPETLVFLDETSTQTVLTRARGRSPPGERLVGSVPRNHGDTITCLAAISAASVIAPCVFERSLDGALFAQWLEEWLLPDLPAGTTIVLDNLSVHKNVAAREAVEAAGCRLLFLPAYSPDFNPIELVFAQLKTHLRRAAARTFDAVTEAIGTGFAAVTPGHLRASYRHCGYPGDEMPSQPL
ncbi:MAG TPA: IS630 family transposase [Thermomicrobiales bacterium]|nr:IS630 family transposase [Thermomicrobiales bacterium]